MRFWENAVLPVRNKGAKVALAPSDVRGVLWRYVARVRLNDGAKVAIAALRLKNRNICQTGGLKSEPFRAVRMCYNSNESE